MRRTLAFLTALLIVTGGVLPLTATAATAAPNADTPENGTDGNEIRNESLRFDYRLSLLPDDPHRIRVELTLTPPADVSTAEITLPEPSTAVRTRNVTDVDSSETGYDYRWERGNGTPSIVYRVNPDDESGLFDGLNSVDAGSWAFVTTTAIEPSIVTRPAIDPPRTASIRVDGEGVGGTSMAYLGPATVRSRTVSGTEVRLVVPEGIKFDADPAFAALTNASRLLRVGDRPPRTTVFVTRDPIRTGGLYTVPGEAVQQSPAFAENLWVHADTDTERSVHTNVWVHEYVHARQGFDTTGGMAWLDEAIASYYESLLTLYATDVEFHVFHRAVSTNEYVDGPLYADEGRAQYEKGARVIAAIDARIHNETDGERSFQDVFARLNTKDRVGINTFVAAVEAVAGTELEAWLEEPIYEAGAPTPPVHAELYDHVERPDVDGDGLNTSVELGADSQPYNPDSDDDGVDDGTELDPDGDGVVEANTGNSSPATPLLGGLAVLTAAVGLAAGGGLVLRYRERGSFEPRTRVGLFAGWPPRLLGVVAVTGLAVAVGLLFVLVR